MEVKVKVEVDVESDVEAEAEVEVEVEVEVKVEVEVEVDNSPRSTCGLELSLFIAKFKFQRRRPFSLQKHECAPVPVLGGAGPKCWHLPI